MRASLRRAHRLHHHQHPRFCARLGHARFMESRSPGGRYCGAWRRGARCTVLRPWRTVRARFQARCAVESGEITCGFRACAARVRCASAFLFLRCLLSVFNRLSSIVYCLFCVYAPRARSVAHWRQRRRGASARESEHVCACVGIFFFFRFGLDGWVVRGAGAMPRGVGDDVGGGPRC